jgi:hypothetical protein
MGLGSLGLDVSVNEVPLSNLYPGYGGANLGVIATDATGMYGVPVAPSGARSTQGVASAPGFLNGVLGTAIVFLVLVIGLWALFTFVGPEEEKRQFANVRLSAVNAFLLSAVPLVGIPIWKGVLNSFPIPAPVRAYVNAA